MTYKLLIGMLRVKCQILIQIVNIYDRRNLITILTLENRVTKFASKFDILIYEQNEKNYI